MKLYRSSQWKCSTVHSVRTSPGNDYRKPRPAGWIASFLIIARHQEPDSGYSCQILTLDARLQIGSRNLLTITRECCFLCAVKKMTNTFTTQQSMQPVKG